MLQALFPITATLFGLWTFLKLSDFVSELFEEARK